MDIAIEAKGLTKQFNGDVAVDNLSLKVRPGEIYGFVGLNGAYGTNTHAAAWGRSRTPQLDIGFQSNRIVHAQHDGHPRLVQSEFRKRKGRLSRNREFVGTKGRGTFPHDLPRHASNRQIADDHDVRCSFGGYGLWDAAHLLGYEDGIGIPLDLQDVRAHILVTPRLVAR